MQTASADYFTGLRDSLTGLALDFARAKFIDVEQASDDQNIPDRADLRAGFSAQSADSVKLAPGGLTIAGWVGLAAVVLGVVWVAKRALR